MSGAVDRLRARKRQRAREHALSGDYEQSLYEDSPVESVERPSVEDAVTVFGDAEGDRAAMRENVRAGTFALGAAAGCLAGAVGGRAAWRAMRLPGSSAIGAVLAGLPGLWLGARAGLRVGPSIASSLYGEPSKVAGDAGTGGAPSLPTDPGDYGPSPAQLQEVARARADKDLRAASAPKPQPWDPQEGQGFLMREAFAGIPWWGVFFGVISLTTIGSGIYYILSD